MIGTNGLRTFWLSGSLVLSFSLRLFSLTNLSEFKRIANSQFGFILSLSSGRF